MASTSPAACAPKRYEICNRLAKSLTVLGSIKLEFYLETPDSSQRSSAVEGLLSSHQGYARSLPIGAFPRPLKKDGQGR